MTSSLTFYLVFRDIEAKMKQLYGVDVSPEMVTRIKDQIILRARKRQNRGLKQFYPIIFLDGVIFDICPDCQIGKKTAYVVFTIITEGLKEVLGI
jgi:transposase-like protein